MPEAGDSYASKPAAILYIVRVIAMCQQCPNWTLLNLECPPACLCWRSPLRLFGSEAVELVSLRAGFAAELRGVGLIDVVSSDAAYLAVREAFEEHPAYGRACETPPSLSRAVSLRVAGPIRRRKGRPRQTCPSLCR